MKPEISKLIRKYYLEKILSPKGNKNFFPSKNITRAIIDGNGKTFPAEIWESVECLSSGDDIDFAGFIRDSRSIAFEQGFSDVPMYSGAFRTISRMMADVNLKQNRLDWINGGLKTSKKSKSVLFVGDLPYYDEIFSADLGYSPLDTARGAVRLLNSIGIIPAVLEDEVSSGYDELWSGDVETFRKLAEKNISAFKKSGAKEIITLDSQSYYSLSKDYTEHFKNFRIPVFHITQKICENINRLRFNKIAESACYHDPCLLGRMSGIYDEPRKMLSRLLENPLIEPAHNRKNAICPGAHRFSNCGAPAKRMQIEALKEAEKAGAEILLTSCPRETAIFRLATRSESWKETNIEIKELVALASELFIQEQLATSQAK